MGKQGGFFALPPALFTALAALLGFAALTRLSPVRQNALGNWLMLVGQVLETNASQTQSAPKGGNGALSDRVAALEQALSDLRQQQ